MEIEILRAGCTVLVLEKLSQSPTTAQEWMLDLVLRKGADDDDEEEDEEEEEGQQQQQQEEGEAVAVAMAKE